MKYNFDEVIDRRGTTSLKWNAKDLLKSMGITDTFNEDTISAFTADMDFKCAQPIIDALHKVVDSGIYGYSGHICDPEYHKSIIKWFKEKRNWDIKEEEIIYVNGTIHALKIGILAYSQEGDGVIIQRPVYTPFTGVINETNRKVVNNQLINNNGYYTIDFEDLEEKAKDPANKVMLLCNPHNPVGRIWSDEDLIRIAQICRENDVVILADEIHGDLLRKGEEFHPIATLVDNSNIVTCTAVNKTFNLAGLHCTNVVIKDEKLREKFYNVSGTIWPTPFTIAAVIAAYNEGDEWLDQLRDYLDGNIDWILNFLKEKMPKVKCYRPEASYILWMDFREYGLSAEEIHDKIYNKANVILEGGKMFDPDHGEGFERICVPVRRAVIEEIFNRIYREFEGL